MRMVPPVQPLTGTRLLVAGLVLALSNFMVVLDTTIANVSVPHIAGGLGVSGSQGTWVITSYAVAEAITVPLTGWLAQRFGTVRTFVACVAGFGLFSVLCGLAPNLGLLVLFRVLQGLAGGPIMPLTQTLLLHIFPKEKAAAATGLWAMTTVVAPIVGPILGGTISDNWSWPWIFYINIPVCLLCAMATFRLLTPFETAIAKRRIDIVGLLLLVVWVGAFQIMLESGREHDWFASSSVVALAIVAAIGFAAFLIWELTEDHPVVDLRVFRHRGFTVGTLAVAVCFGTFFASIVLIPQWLQLNLGYTATWAGYATAFIGVLAVVMAPVVAMLTTKVDTRLLVCFGILWLGGVSFLRTQWYEGVDFWTLALPQLIQGFGMPFFFVGATTLALAAVLERETASAAGVMNFLRTLAGAIGASVATTMSERGTQASRAELAGVLNDPERAIAAMQVNGLSPEQARAALDHMVQSQAFTLATTEVFFVSAVLFILAASIIWLAPKPTRAVDVSAAH
jgi:DHA2 family multidrug resistance protein